MEQINEMRHLKTKTVLALELSQKKKSFLLKVLNIVKQSLLYEFSLMVYLFLQFKTLFCTVKLYIIFHYVQLMLSKFRTTFVCIQTVVKSKEKIIENDCQELDLVRTIVHLKICCTRTWSVFTMPRWNFNKPETEL